MNWDIKQKHVMNNQWFVYILRCSDNSLYTGVTIDIDRRVSEHNFSKKGASYTKRRRPCVLCHVEGPMTKSEAYKREYAIKQLSKKEKEKIIKCQQIESKQQEDEKL